MKDMFIRIINKIKEVGKAIGAFIVKVSRKVADLLFNAIIRVEGWMQTMIGKGGAFLFGGIAIGLRAIGLALVAFPVVLMFSKSAWSQYKRMWQKFAFLVPEQPAENVMHIHHAQKTAKASKKTSKKSKTSRGPQVKTA